MNTFKTLSALVLLAPIVAVVSGSPVLASGAGYQETLNQARSLYKEVDDLGGAWSTTEDMISSAEAAAAAGKEDEAMKLLKEAIDESTIARKQFDAQKNAGPTLF